MSMVDKVVSAIFPLVWKEEFEGTDDAQREHVEAIARAAIGAMREPTDAMYDALTDKMWKHSNSTEVWQKMIDAAGRA